MSDILHRTKEGWFCPTLESVCAECGKKFKRTDEHIYVRYVNYRESVYCSYTCYRVYARQQEAKKKAAEPDWDEEPEELSEIEQAEKRVAQCHEKIAEYTQRKRRTTNKVRRDTAQKT